MIILYFGRFIVVPIVTIRLFRLSYIDKDIMKKSGRIQVSAELGREYGFKDVGGEIA